LAREICLRQLAVRPRTRGELATALRRRGISDDAAAEVLDRYAEVGVIDDELFARAWVTSRHHSRGLSRRVLAVELRRKGVDGDTTDAALEDLDPDTEEETARALVVRKLRVERSGQPQDVVRRLVGMLARKGYPQGMAFRVVKEVLAERVEQEQAESDSPGGAAGPAGSSRTEPGRALEGKPPVATAACLEAVELLDELPDI